MHNHLIKAGTAILGNGEILHDAFILTREGVIAEIGIEKPASDSARSIDYSDRVVMPGLIDPHVHLCHDGGTPDPAESRKLADNYLAIRGAKFAESLLHSGVTTVGDAAGRGDVPFAIRDAIKKGIVQGPRILPCGRMITITGGRDSIYAQNEADGPDDVRRATREEIARGARFIKLAATGAISSENTESMHVQFTMEEMQAAVEEAHKVGIMTHAHAYGDEGIENTIRAGVDVLVHGHPLNEQNIELMKKSGTMYMPTLVTYHESQLHHHEGNLPQHMIRKEKELYPLMEAGARKAVSAGLRIVLGSDSGMPYTPFGRSSMEELQLFVDMAGMDEMNAIVAGTQNAAKALRIENLTGTLEKGKSADLLVLESGIDPLRDISLLQNQASIDNVMLMGRFLEPV
ncbi:amidohydrolase family protein [Candidatus Thorarchaeota archaeon]|nr:MAG: amidohydrolase family protein [Candidatus Thorarchaeota archaeon]